MLADAGFDGPDRRRGRRRRGRGDRPARRCCVLPAVLGAGVPRPARWSGCSSGRRGRRLPRAAAQPGGRRRRCGCRCVCATAGDARSACVLGVPLAWLLARGELPRPRLVRALVTVPLVLPPVVGGVALLLVLGRRGLRRAVPRRAGSGSRCRSPPPAVVVAEAFVAHAVPGHHRRGRAARRRPRATRRPPRRSAPSRWTVVPPGHAAAGRARASPPARCCAGPARSGEFGATITFAGNFPGRTQTMPLAVYLALETDPRRARSCFSLVLLAVSVAVLVGLRDRWLTGGRRP